MATMYYLQWYVIVVFLLSLNLALECPQGMGCSTCQGLTHEEYEIQCSTSKMNSKFNVKFKPNEWVEITCYHSPNWSEFSLGTIQKLQHAKAISFRMCNLPEDVKLSDIAKQMITNNIEELKFESYDDLTSTLTRDALGDFKNIQKLTLSSNSLTNVTFDLLHDLEGLTLLNLRQNQLRELPKEFLNLQNLETIELGSNQLEVIKSTTFEKLVNLKLLNIWNNKLVEIKPHSFDALKSLRWIDMHQNKLQTLPEDIFAQLPNLKSINLSQNNFTSTLLPKNLFKNISLLEVVAFFDNKQNLTTLPSKFFANLTNLRIVKMKRNGLLYLPEDLFMGTSNLRNVSMERNYLTTLPVKIFNDCKNLSTINLSFNELTHLPDGIFLELNKLEELDLSRNHLTTINNTLFDGLFSLKVLNVERNELKIIHTYSLRPLQNLRIARFSNNQLTLKPSNTTFIDEFGPRSPFHHCIETIEELHLAHNNISDIFGDWILARHLRKLNLHHNDMRVLQTTDLQFIADNLNVDLSYNQIESVSLQNAEIISLPLKYPKDVIITIGNNPINCDCNIYDLLRYREGIMHPKVQSRFHLNMTDLKCYKPNWLANTVVEQIKSQSLKCLVEEPQVYNATCPEECSCWIHPAPRVYIIDCSYKGMREGPKTLRGPMGLDIEMNLTGNSLSTMPLMTQSGYHAVKSLSLSRNKISEVSVAALSKNLEVLMLDSNNLTRLDIVSLDFLSNSTKLKYLTLDGNPWTCDCDARDLLSFIQIQRVKIPQLQKVTCGNTGSPIFEISVDELCPLAIGWIIGVCIGVALLGMIVGSIAALYYRYQNEIKVWLYARQWCLWFVTEDELDKDKLYDAFVSYSHKDEDFVVNHLVSKLEEGDRPFKLCIHYRDWMAGEWIPTQIARSVEDSRRTIVVVSPNFLESIWGRIEFRTAHNQALSEGRARVIVILYGEIGPIEQLDTELKAYLSMNTYVKWGDPWFWEKLRYALPHPDHLIKKKRKPTIFKMQHSTSPIVKSNLSEVSRLNITTATATSTPPAETFKTFGNNEKEMNKNLVNDSLNKESNKVIDSAKILTHSDSVKKNVAINMLECTTV